MRAEDVLPDDTDYAVFNGIAARKGTVAAFLANARIWSDLSRPAEVRAEAERHIVEAIPALGALGLFDVLTIKDERLRNFVEANKGG